MAEQSTGGAVISGAASGAAVGAVAGPWGAVIGGAIGAIGGFLSASSANAGGRRQARSNRKAQRMLRPQRILGVAQQFQPEFRAMVARGIGPGIEGKIAAGLARSGYDETGVGQVLQGMALQMPGVVASNAALEFARQTQLARANSILGAPSIPAQKNAILEGVAGGLQGGLGTWLALQKANRPQIAPGVQAIPAQPASVAPTTGFYPSIERGPAGPTIRQPSPQDWLGMQRNLPAFF